MTKDEALKKVLVTLEWFEERKHLNYFDWQTQHIADIKEALAQPERDPWREAAAQPERDPWREATAQPEERNFCPRCGKRLASGFVEISIHTCTPPREKNT